ncbi:hypothetical protein AGMMS49938_13300 [Fibrobacterales bacterium]|nr:hypothetical protein AGMMS49938_13300 [Fibrobacterales bacterium]
MSQKYLVLKCLAGLGKATSSEVSFNVLKQHKNEFRGAANPNNSIAGILSRCCTDDLVRSDDYYSYSLTKKGSDYLKSEEQGNSKTKIKHESVRNEKKSSKRDIGYVYVFKKLQKENSPIKIGMCREDQLETRLKLANSEFVDKKIVKYATIKTKYYKEMEKAIHEKLHNVRQKGKEFFDISAEESFSTLEDVAKSLAKSLDSEIEIAVYYQYPPISR